MGGVDRTREKGVEKRFAFRPHNQGWPLQSVDDFGGSPDLLLYYRDCGNLVIWNTIISLYKSIERAQSTSLMAADPTEQDLYERILRKVNKEPVRQFASSFWDSRRSIRRAS